MKPWPWPKRASTQPSMLPVLPLAPLAVTVRSPDAETLSGYLVAKEGFTLLEEDGRYWVYPEGEAPADGKHPAKHITKVKAGPGGVTLRGPDADTILAYIASKPGFHVEIEDGRIWVFKPVPKATPSSSNLASCQPST